MLSIQTPKILQIYIYNMNSNWWKGQANDVPTEDIQIPQDQWDEYCEDYDDRCPTDTPDTLSDLIDCTKESDSCENALNSLFWRCHHSEDAEETQDRLEGNWNEDPANVCYGIQKSYFASGLGS